MKEDNPNPYFLHDEIALLLPWYINQTLDETETKAVENHLKVCLLCNRDLSELEKLALAVKQANILDAEARASFSRLQARMRGPDGAAAVPRKSRTRKKPRFNFTPLFSYRAVAALLAAVLLIPGYLIVDGSFSRFENRYRTLADSETLPAHDDEIRLVFSESADSEQKNAVIESIAGEIIEGPNAMGVYLIRLKQTPTPRQAVEILAALRKHPKVVFAEPGFSLSAAISDPERPQ